MRRALLASALLAAGLAGCGDDGATGDERSVPPQQAAVKVAPQTELPPLPTGTASSGAGRLGMVRC